MIVVTSVAAVVVVFAAVVVVFTAVVVVCRAVKEALLSEVTAAVVVPSETVTLVPADAPGAVSLPDICTAAKTPPPIAPSDGSARQR